MVSDRAERVRIAACVVMCAAVFVGSRAGPGRAIELADVPGGEGGISSPPGGCRASGTLDRDRDGEPDLACVGDWDGDGTYELLDIQAAVDALTDDGDKLVRLLGVRYVAPVESDEPDAVIRLRSRTTLAGTSGTVLVGFDDGDPTSRAAVVGAFDGQELVTIRDLEIDGNWFDGDASAIPGVHRMGVYLRDCTGCRVERLVVHDTQHACIYAKNGTDLVVRDNDLERCGNVAGLGPRYVCMYFFADQGEIHEQISAEANRCLDSSGGVSLRRADAVSIVRDVTLRDNEFVDMRRFDGAPGPCIVLRGAEQVHVSGGVCRNTGSIQTVDVGGYYANGDVNAVKDVLVEDVLVEDVGPYRDGLLIRDHVDGLTVRDVTVRGTGAGSACLAFTQPQRLTVYEGLDLRDCGTRGIRETSLVALAGDPAERPLFRDIRVENVAELDGVWLRSDSSVRFEGVELTGIDRYGFLASGALYDSELVDLTVTNAGSDGIHVAGDLDGVTLQGTVVDGVGGSGVELRSSGTIVATVDAASIAHTGGHGVFLPGNAGGALEIDSVQTEFTTGNGISVSTSGTVAVSDTAIHWCGSTAPTSSARGLEIVGASDVSLASITITDAGTATAGVWLDVAAGASSACAVTCLGLDVAACRVVVGDPSFGTDADGDGIPDACE